MRIWDAEAVQALGPRRAVDAVLRTLEDGLDPAADPPRTILELARGQFLLMPSETSTATGVKIVTIAPDNPARSLPRIHAQYLLFDRDTLMPTGILDGTALTTLRTPAVSVAAVLRQLPDRALRLAVIGAGPQATAHVATLAAVRPLESATFLVRDPSRAPVPATQLGTAAARHSLESADVVVCATTARTPVLDGSLARDDAIVIAVGSHEPDARELDAGLLARSTVVVEDVATALREAGDIILAIGEGRLAAGDLVTMPDLVQGRIVPPRERPLVFKSVGMSWEDLAIAEAVVAHQP